MSATIRHPHVEVAAGSAGLIPERDGGVPLRRLLRVARLTEAQAAVLAADVLRALEKTGARGPSPPAVDGETVRVGPAGTAWLSLPPTAGPGHDPVVSAAALLGDLVQASRRPGVARGAGSDGPLAALQATDVGSLRSDGFGRTAARLYAAVGETARIEQVRRELAALATAMTARPPATEEPPPEGRHGGRVRAVAGTGWSRSWRGLAALAVLALVVVLEVVLLGDDIRRDVRLLRELDVPQTVTPPPTGRPPSPVPVRGPDSAGPLVGIDARALRACAAGGPCRVRVGVRVQPADAATPVAWRLVAFDRCAGTWGGEAAGGVTVPPRADHAYGLTTVDLPRSRSVAIVAVTTHPTVVAAVPLPVPADGGRC